MDKQIQKLKKLVAENLNKTKGHLLTYFGVPVGKSDNEVWIYNRYNWGISKEEISFILEDDIVIDIMITEYIFWKEVRNTFFYQGQDPEYRVIKFL